MSVALYLVLEKDIPGVDASSVCGKSLVRAQSKLDRLAEQQGLTPLEDFTSADPDETADFLEAEGGIPEDLEIPPEEWFDPADGLKTVQGLLEILRKKPATVKDADGVSEDLKAAEKVLLAAQKRKVRFHLAIDF